MVFSSPLFLLLFLPLTLGAYYCVPRRARNGVLLAASLLFYAWGELRYLPLVIAPCCSTAGSAFALATRRARARGGAGSPSG